MPSPIVPSAIPRDGVFSAARQAGDSNQVSRDPAWVTRAEGVEWPARYQLLSGRAHSRGVGCVVCRDDIMWPDDNWLECFVYQVRCKQGSRGYSWPATGKPSGESRQKEGQRASTSITDVGSSRNGPESGVQTSCMMLTIRIAPFAAARVTSARYVVAQTQSWSSFVNTFPPLPGHHPRRAPGDAAQNRACLADANRLRPGKLIG